LKYKHDGIIEKAQKRELQVAHKDEMMKIRCLKQREIDNLRCMDNSENLDSLKNQNFVKNCQIVEKHLALSILNQEKKQFMSSFDDKYRSKMAKEQILLKDTHGNNSPY